MSFSDWLARRNADAARPGQVAVPGISRRATARTEVRPEARPDFGHARTLPEGRFRFIALDVETACGEPGSICQIGLACVQPDNTIQTFSMLIDPGTRFDAFNIRLHGIGPAEVRGAPRFAEALATILPLLRHHPLVQHSNFDRRAINSACVACRIAPPRLHWSDSVQIARRAWPEFRGNGGHGLAHLKRALGLQFHHHDAGEDARAAALVVLRAEARLAVTFENMIRPVTASKRPGRSFGGAPAPDQAPGGGHADPGSAYQDPYGELQTRRGPL